MILLSWPATQHSIDEGPALGGSLTIHAHAVLLCISTTAIFKADVSSPFDDLHCYVSSRLCILQLASVSASCLYSTIMKLDVYLVNASNLHLFIVV